MMELCLYIIRYISCCTTASSMHAVIISIFHQYIILT